MQSIIIGKMIVKRLFLPLSILLFFTACNHNKSKDFVFVPQPINEPYDFQEQIELLNKDLSDRRASYQRQLVWDKQELDQKIKQFIEQLSLANQSTLKVEIDRLSQEQALVQSKIDVLFESDVDNWEEAGFIADEALANLQRSYDSLIESNPNIRSQLEESHQLKPASSHPKWEIYRI